MKTGNYSEEEENKITFNVEEKDKQKVGRGGRE